MDLYDLYEEVGKKVGESNVRRYGIVIATINATKEIYTEAMNNMIKEMQSKKTTYPTPSKENWNKEVIARNSGIDECIEIVNNYLKGGEDFG